MAAPQLSTVEEVLSVLQPNKGKGSSMQGGSGLPDMRVMLKQIDTDLDAKSATATILVSGWEFDSGGRSHKIQREFILSQEAMQRLAKEAGDHRLAFSVAASTMKSQLAKELQAKQDFLDHWYSQGAPTSEDTKVMKPLKFKPPGTKAH